MSERTVRTRHRARLQLWQVLGVLSDRAWSRPHDQLDLALSYAGYTNLSAFELGANR